ncbi:MAG TPA: hypothetical protein VNY51_03640 [Candidatus Dormibacteraeota bacterium]|nr:hypothetical protein [Candidatus Dormibacteraeota bacterium]
MARRKPVRGWRTYRSVAGKVVSEIDVANDDMPGVTIFFRDGTQFHIEVRRSVEFQVRLQKMIDGDLVVLHTFPRFKEVKR